MIKHIVLLKINDDENKTNAKKIKALVEDLKNHIKMVDIEVGLDIGFDKSASDIAIYSVFENRKDLEVYATHPKHLEVIEFIKSVAIERRAVDYEVNDA